MTVLSELEDWMSSIAFKTSYHVFDKEVVHFKFVQSLKLNSESIESRFFFVFIHSDIIRSEIQSTYDF